MAREMSPERKREFAELSDYLGYFATHVWKIDPASPAHPSRALGQLQDKFGQSKAFTGLKQAVNDTVEALCHEPPESVEALDKSLREHGLVTFSEIRRRYSASYARILKRGVVKNDTEFHLVAGILADTSSQVADEERAVLESLISAYESAR